VTVAEQSRSSVEMRQQIGSDAPYPGLRPFRSSESDIFFGREGQVDQLLLTLKAAHFVGIVGPSGCGKSSLARAGLIVGLEAGLLESGLARWVIVTMKPGRQPYRNLAAAVVRALELTPSRSVVDDVERTLHRGPFSLVDLFRGSKFGDSANLFLLVDQFEEIFPEGSLQAFDRAQEFIRLMLASAGHRQVYVGLTMRSDELGKCEPFADLSEALSKHQFLASRMTRKDCERAIMKPAEVFGGSIDRSLVVRMQNEIDPSVDQLPILQHAMMRLWAAAGQRLGIDPADTHLPRRIQAEDYDAIGGVREALANDAEEAFAAVPAAQRGVIESVFRSLTAPPDKRRRSPIGDVARTAGVSVDALIGIIAPFTDAARGFLTIDGDLDDPNASLDIPHESLIRQWWRLEAWVDDEREQAATFQYLLFGLTNKSVWGSAEIALADKIGIGKPNREAWAERYASAPDDYARMTRTLRRSKRYRRLVRLGVPMLIIAAIAVAAIVVTYIRVNAAKNEATAKAAAAAAKAAVDTARASALAASAQLRLNRVAQEYSDHMASEQRQLLVVEKRNAARLLAEKQRGDSLQADMLASFGMRSARAQIIVADKRASDAVYDANRLLNGPRPAFANAATIVYPAGAVDTSVVNAQLRGASFVVRNTGAVSAADTLYDLRYGRHVSREDVRRTAYFFIRAGLAIAASPQPAAESIGTSVITLSAVRNGSRRAWTPSEIAQWTGGNDAVGFIHIGTRPGFDADLFVNGQRRQHLDSLSVVTVPIGETRVRLTRANCRWPAGSADSVISILPGDTIRIGYRYATCGG
jgi:hypothetical protein